MSNPRTDFFKTLACPKCKLSLNINNNFLICKKGHKYDIASNVPIFANLNKYLLNEAKAWEDEWRKGINEKSLEAYKLNMKVFKKLGFWEETGEAANLIPSDKSMNVLDIGCGNGSSTANIVGKIVIGMDLSQKQMVRAKKTYKNSNYLVGDATCLPFKNNTFDLVVAINLLHHVDNPKKVINECFRVLNKGGRLLTVDPNLYNPIGYLGRAGYRIFRLDKIFPKYPQFALGEKERQFTKKQYYSMFNKSKFNDYKIKPHRIERLLFFATILFPILVKLPHYESLLYFVSKLGNSIVKYQPIDQLCYFWICEARK